MRKQGLSDEQVLDGLLLFARSHLVSGGSLRVKAYNAWPDRPVSFSAITKRFGDNSWTRVVLRFRTEMLAQAKDLDVVAAELPVPCRRDAGISWVPGRIGDWLSLRCDCEACQSPTLRVAHPELVGRLEWPDDADMGSMVRFAWACPERRPRHRPVLASVERLLAGKVRCLGCREADKFYRQHPAGSLRHNPGVERSKTEAPLIQALSALLPGQRFATRQSVVIGPDHATLVGRTITPDILMVRHKLAIEIDGGDGKSPNYSRHDNPAGGVVDANRDFALSSVGWKTLRLRHLDALPLLDSPATVVTCASRSPNVMAAALAPAIHSIVHQAPIASWPN